MISDDMVNTAAGWLKDPDVQTRDAVISFLESCADGGSKRAIEVLEAHTDPAPWLADYVRRVVAHYRLARSRG